MRAGQPVSPRDAIRLARAVESKVVRAAEAVLEADDAHLVARVTELALELLLASGTNDEAVSQ